MAHPYRDRKSWTLKARQPKKPQSRQPKAKPESERAPQALELPRKPQVKTSSLSKKDRLLHRVWGSQVPAELRALSVDIKECVETEDKAVTACRELVASLGEVGTWKAKHFSKLKEAVLPLFLTLTLRRFSSELGGDLAARDAEAHWEELQDAFFDTCWLELLAHVTKGLGGEASGNARSELELSRVLPVISCVYLNALLMLLSSDSNTAASGLMMAVRILEALLDASAASDRLIPITEPLVYMLTLAFDNLPLKAEKGPSPVLKDATAFSDALRANFMQMDDAGFHLYVALRGVDALVKYVHLLHMHPAFVELSGILLAQLLYLHKQLESRLGSTKIAERVKQIIAAVKNTVPKMEALRGSLVSEETPLRLEVFDFRTRQPWGIEALRAKLFF